MIIKLINNSNGKTAICKCDYCSKQVSINYARASKMKHHFCNRDCYGNFKEYIQNCIVCNKKRDNTFYDKSDTRPLCSKVCRDKYYDNLPDRLVKKDFDYDKYTEPRNTYTYHKTGKLVLTDYNLSRIW